MLRRSGVFIFLGELNRDEALKKSSGMPMRWFLKIVPFDCLNPGGQAVSYSFVP